MRLESLELFVTLESKSKQGGKAGKQQRLGQARPWEDRRLKQRPREILPFALRAPLRAEQDKIQEL